MAFILLMMKEIEIAMQATPFRVEKEKPTTKEFCKLRHGVGWGETDEKMAKASLDSTLFHVVVRLESQLVGMGRVVGDGFMYFYIQDVVVDPEYQKQGVGDLIMQEIELYLSTGAKPGSTIGLLAAKGKEEFYSRYGYINRPSDSLGNGMCKFK